MPIVIAAGLRQQLRVMTNATEPMGGRTAAPKTRRMSMSTTMNTVIVGGGQAGLSVSHFLTKLSVDHLVLEQADMPGEAWRNHRWDSFTLNTPRWQSRLPGDRFGGDDADGFMPKDEIVARFEELARPLPVRYGARVVAIERDSASGTYVVEIDGDRKITARNVVVATGLHQTAKIPALSRDFPSHIKQLHSESYRNPEELPPGAVLVVGSAQSGAQIAEELYESGRKVFLAVGRAGRTPRRYRGKDAYWWIDGLGHYDRKVSELPSPKAKFSGKPHISGTKGGHTINLHQFAHDGVILLGRLAGVRGGVLTLAGDLHDNLAAADRAEAELVKAVDAYVAQTGMVVQEETLPVVTDGFAQPILTELDLEAAGITNVIWATGYNFDFSIVRLPVVDGDGFPIQTRGVSAAYAGLFFVGLPWLHTAKSGLIYGVGDDASYIADRIAERRDQVLPATGATRRFARAARVALSATAFALSISSASGSEPINPPAAPYVAFLATAASGLYPGMAAQEVNRVMGEAAKEKRFVADGIEGLRLEFPGAIPTEVTLSDGKVASVAIDVFRTDSGDLPAFSHKAWPGMASSAVRRMLGEPAEVLPHTFDGIHVDQWVYSYAGEACVSVYFRADRVIARAVGRDVPADLLQVDLPSPPKAESEDPLPTARVGMTASDVKALYGAVRFSIDYVFNGQPASRVVFEPRGKGTYAGVTFVDGVVTGFEDLGRLPDDPSFQGR
jgi:putative flavoprotein involved in K+ transport